MWQDINTAPKDELVLLSAVGWHPFKPSPVKVGGYWDGKWNIFGASWKPTHWMKLPAPPDA
jgi:hypothetical protein